MKDPNISGGNMSLNAFLFLSTEYRNLSTLKQCSCISCWIFMFSLGSSLYFLGLSLLYDGQFYIRILPIIWAPCNLIFILFWSFSDKFVKIVSIDPTRMGLDRWTYRSSKIIWTTLRFLISIKISWSSLVTV